MKLIFSVNVTLPKKSVHDHALVHRLKHSTVLTLRTDFLDCCVYMAIPVCSLEHRIASHEMPICLSCPFTLTNRLLRRENISFPSLKVLTHLKGLSSSSHYVLNNITRFISFFLMLQMKSNIIQLFSAFPIETVVRVQQVSSVIASASSVIDEVTVVAQVI